MEQMFGMRCCMDVVSVVAWTFAEYSRHDQLLPTSVCSSRFQLLGPRSLRGTFGDRGQQRLDCSSNFFADRVSQTSAPDPTSRSTFMEVVREQDVDTHVLSSVCPWI